MKISLNWLSDYIDIEPFQKDLKVYLEKLALRGLEVESVHYLSKGFEKVIIGQILTKEKHPQADRLSICTVSTGNENLQIVCGAQNMKPQDKVALSLIGAVLPNGVKIEKNKIRGIESFGMLCSEVELGLAEKSDGILILSQDAPVGKPLAPYLDRDDIVLEFNITPNRGDLLSYIGVAREVAPMFGQTLKLPSFKSSSGLWVDARHVSAPGVKAPVNVTLHNPINQPDLCLQYHGLYIEGIKIAPSPMWLQKKLKAVGLRPINNIVDITNFVLLEWGTPLHAFDYEKIKQGEIHVRLAKNGEKLPLLDGSTVALTEQDLVIADAQKPVALAGVMGGANSEVSNETTSILLEAAQFDPSTIRKTAKRHQKQTDSSYRFERQVDARAVEKASERAASLIAEYAGGRIFSGAVSQFSPLGEKKAKGIPNKVSFLKTCLDQFVGEKIPTEFIQKELPLIGFETRIDGDPIATSVPSYRPDVTCPEEVYEEVLRVWGYEKISPQIPALKFIQEPNVDTEWKEKNIWKIKQALVAQGFSEAINFAFTSEAKNQNWILYETPTIEIENPINEELKVLKTSLIGGLFESFLIACHHQQQNVRLFEVRTTYVKDESKETGVCEKIKVAGILSGRSYSASLAARDRGLDFFDVKGIVESFLDAMKCRRLQYRVLEKNIGWVHPAQAAQVILGKNQAGIVARLHPQFEADNKFKMPVFIFEVDIESVLDIAKREFKFASLSKFPKAPREFSLLVPKNLDAEEVMATIQKLGKPLIEEVHVIDVYTGDKIPQDLRSISVSFILGDPNRTLEEKEIDTLTSKILDGLNKEHCIKLRT